MRRAVAAVALVVSMVAVGCAHKEEVKPEAPSPMAQPQPSAQGQQPMAGAEGGDLAQWNSNHPDAARGLCAWVSQHREASRLFFQWDASHTENAHEFVSWSIAHPVADIEDFVRQHHGWQQFDTIMERHRPAAESFMRWSRQHPAAAEQLLNHPGGLQWAGQHLAC